MPLKSLLKNSTFEATGNVGSVLSFQMAFTAKSDVKSSKPRTKTIRGVYQGILMSLYLHQNGQGSRGCGEVEYCGISSLFGN